MSPKKKTRAGITEEQIAVRAYERWMGRGAPVSDGAEDWFAARLELEVERARPARKAAPRKLPAKPKATQSAASIH